MMCIGLFFTSHRRLQARYGQVGELWGSFTQMGQLWNCRGRGNECMA